MNYGYPSLHDALANNNVHDSNRLQNHTPRNPFRHLNQQRKHHSIRPSHHAKQHAQKQRTQQTTQQIRRPHSRHVHDGFCRENGSCIQRVTAVPSMQRGCVHVHGQLYGRAVRVFALSLEFYSRSFIAVWCRHDEALENSRARVLASAHDAHEE